MFLPMLTLVATFGATAVEANEAERIHEGYWAVGLYGALDSAPIIIHGRVAQTSRKSWQETSLPFSPEVTQAEGIIHVEEVLRGDFHIGDQIPYRWTGLTGAVVSPSGDPYIHDPWNNLRPEHDAHALFIGDAVREDGSLELHTFARGRAYGYWVLVDGMNSADLRALRRFFEIRSLESAKQAVLFRAAVTANASAANPVLLRRLAVLGLLEPEVGRDVPLPRTAGIVAAFLRDVEEPLAFREELLQFAVELLQEHPEQAQPILDAFLGIWQNIKDLNRFREEVLSQILVHLDLYQSDLRLVSALRLAVSEPALAAAPGRNDGTVVIVDAHGFVIMPAYNTKRLETLRSQIADQLAR
jgi:hypothetical protein